MTIQRTRRKKNTSAVGKRLRSGKAAARKADLSARERRWLAQLVACGGIFILIVAAKLLLPGHLESVRARLRGVMEQNMDIRGVFSVVGQAAAGEKPVDQTLDEVYQAVFHPQEKSEPLQTTVLLTDASGLSKTRAMDSLRDFRTEREAAGKSEADRGETETEALALVLYSDQNLPEQVSMEQAILGFTYCTPVAGTISSGFGYREHPTEGEERFHYGLDLAADTGTAIACFADGTVKAVGESSSYGKYIIVSHTGGYDTLYAHCSSIDVSSGAKVSLGQTIARVGDTGIATGPHLHFELHRDGVYLNPVYYVAV